MLQVLARRGRDRDGSGRRFANPAPFMRTKTADSILAK
jgi:hypothetical protein